MYIVVEEEEEEAGAAVNWRNGINKVAGWRYLFAVLCLDTRVTSLTLQRRGSFSLKFSASDGSRLGKVKKAECLRFHWYFSSH